MRKQQEKNLKWNHGKEGDEDSEMLKGRRREDESEKRRWEEDDEKIGQKGEIGC